MTDLPPPGGLLPPAAVNAALLAACQSPCVKSKRGAAVFHPFSGFVSTGAYNSRPDMKCDQVCQPGRHLGGVIQQGRNEISKCSQMCLHAEQRAIRFALSAFERSQFVADGDFAFPIHDCELVHVKIDNTTGNLVPSGPPSCILCAKEIADVGLYGVWLYEERAWKAEDPDSKPGWNFYTTKTFWERTLKECGLV